MSADAEAVAAIRTGVALSDGAQLACVRLAGSGAHDVLDRVSPRQLFVRTGQMLHTLLLDATGTPIADVYLCCDEDDYLVIAEGLSGPSVAAYLRDHAGGLDVRVEDLSSSHAFVSLDGPFAWELLSELASPDVIGLPYLSFFHEGRFTCFRGGKTGEYGYDLLVAREHLAEIRDRIVDVGRRFDLRHAGLDALELCGLEAGFFNIRRDVRAGLTPIELQLQWRVTHGRAFPGSSAVADRRHAPRGRVTLVAAAHALGVDSTIELDGRVVGSVLANGYSPTRAEHLALALLEPAVCHAGLAGFTNAHGPVRTISSPAVNNRSLYVDPQRHTWATRDSTSFPPLVRPAWS